MNRVGFSFEVFAELIFTPDEVRNLLKCSAIHFDHYCESVGKEGGFLWAMKVAFIDVDDGEEEGNFIATPCRLSFRQVDTLCKILEATGADLDLASKLTGVLRDINKAGRKVRET